MKCLILIFTILFSFQFRGSGQVDTSFVLVGKIGIKRGAAYHWQDIADSINSYSKTKIFPDFLKDECIDWNVSFWEGFHSPVSVRWKVLSLVTEKRSLELLLQKRPEVLKRKCNLKRTYQAYPGDLTPPLINISMYELIIRRLKELN